MKKVILSVLITVGIVVAANAQSQQVNVNVILNPLRSLEITGSDVDLIYTTAADYQNGVSKTMENHLRVTNIGGGFKVYAKATSQFLTRTGGSETIDGQGVTIAVDGGETRTIANVATQNDDGRTLGPKVLQGEGFVNNQAYNVTYTAAGSNEYTNKIIGNAPTKYTVLVTYSIDTN